MTDVYEAPKAKGVEEGYPRRMIEHILTKLKEPKGRECFGAYQVSPGKRFINEQDDEEVVLLLRAHPITNLKWILIAMVLVVFPEILLAIGLFNIVPEGFVLIGKLAWYLGISAYMIENFLNWFYSVFIVTNERVVDINFVNLLTRIINYANLNHIETPSMVAGGLVRSLFKYGNVFVATAAEGPAPQAEAVPFPERVIRIISELSEELEKRRERGE